MTFGRDNVLGTVALIGCGIRGHHDLTLRAITRLTQAKRVFSVGISPRTRLQLRLLGIRRITNLDSLYVNGLRDIDVYSNILGRVERSAKMDRDVALLIPGHPGLGVTISSWFRDLDHKGIIKLDMVDGISSFDTMITDLGIDPLESGALLIDANRMIMRNLPVSPQFDVFIYHICSVLESKLNYKNPGKTSNLERLREKLLADYSDQHMAVLISTNISGPPTVVQSTIGDLPLLRDSISFATSLFLPALRIASK